ncbi:MAG: phosphotriesterase [Actinobacteria bacterium]|nr:phosphotriesterase [Actinomycetota bacterium]
MTQVATVTGDVPSSELGVTLTHEHLSSDISSMAAPDQDHAALFDLPVAEWPRNLLLDHPFASKDNCTLDDRDAVTQDVLAFAATGGRTILEATPDTLGRNPGELVDLSQRTGVQIVMGCGWYLNPVADIADQPTEALVASLLGALSGTDNPGHVRSGFIGEIGVSADFTVAEHRSLEAACRAQTEAGVPLQIHLPGWLRSGHLVVDYCETFGVDPAAIVLCHMNPSGDDVAYQMSLLRRGAWLGYDMVSMGMRFPEGVCPTAEEDEHHLTELFNLGYAGNVLLSHDVFLKAQFSRFGGAGLVSAGEMLSRIGQTLGRPTLARELLVDNPRRLFEMSARSVESTQMKSESKKEANS